MVEISTLYGHLKTLTSQWFYTKEEINDDFLAKSATAGLVKNDGTIDTNVYLTEHQDISNYVQKSETAGLIKNDGTIDTTQYQTAGDYIEKSATSGLVKNDGTIDTTTYQEAGDYIEKSATAGLVKNDGSIDTSVYLTEHQDISGKANSADLATVATSGSYTDLENIPSTFAPSAHEHATSEIKDATAYESLGTSANATQAAINSAIDTKIGSLLAVELIEVVADLGTASADTMNKLYLVAESTSKTNDAYEIYVTVRTGTSGSYSYDWEKVDTARIDLSGYAAIDHVHGNLTNDGKLGTNADYFAYTSTGGLLAAKEKIGNITTDGAIGTDSGKIVVTTTSGVLTTSTTVDEMDATIQSLISYGESLNN